MSRAAARAPSRAPHATRPTPPRPRARAWAGVSSAAARGWWVEARTTRAPLDGAEGPPRHGSGGFSPHVRVGDGGPRRGEAQIKRSTCRCGSSPASASSRRQRQQQRRRRRFFLRAGPPPPPDRARAPQAGAGGAGRRWRWRPATRAWRGSRPPSASSPTSPSQVGPPPTPLLYYQPLGSPCNPAGSSRGWPAACAARFDRSASCTRLAAAAAWPAVDSRLFVA